MTFAQAAKQQYGRTSFYTVWLVSPTGERTHLANTAQRTGRGLLLATSSVHAQRIIAAAFPDAPDVRFTKHADRLSLSNGWSVVFGGTIRQEAEAED